MQARANLAPATVLSQVEDSPHDAGKGVAGVGIGDAGGEELTGSEVGQSQPLSFSVTLVGDCWGLPAGITEEGAAGVMEGPGESSPRSGVRRGRSPSPAPMYDIG